MSLAAVVRCRGTVRQFVAAEFLWPPRIADSMPDAMLDKPNVVAYGPEARLLAPPAISPKPVQPLPVPTIRSFDPVRTYPLGFSA
jgi:hypothetical protein